MQPSQKLKKKKEMDIEKFSKQPFLFLYSLQPYFTNISLVSFAFEYTMTS